MGSTETGELEVALPRARTGELAGLIELLARRGGHEGLAEIADELRYEIDDLLPIVDAGIQLDTAVDWGRYAELFEYDAGSECLTGRVET
jgi:NitT/TauT family transport system ATP-binding protein